MNAFMYNIRVTAAKSKLYVHIEARMIAGAGNRMRCYLLKIVLFVGLLSSSRTELGSAGKLCAASANMC